MNKNRQTPQQKKAFSYHKDCRNCYGENNKASRKAIPLRKAKVNRAFRRNVNQNLKQVSFHDREYGELIDYKILTLTRSKWTKYPDEPLARNIWRKLERRRDLGMRIKSNPFRKPDRF
jgi:hypothetical protein